MKLKKATYSSLFFLLCFVTSFAASTLQNFNLKKLQSTISHSKLVKLSSKEEQSSNGNDVLLEEVENEIEDVCEAQLFVLPYFISFFKQQLSIIKVNSVTPLAETLTNPIYIAVCNFRI